MWEVFITVLPSYLNLDYFSLIRLATLIMSLSICVYLFSIKEKSFPTILLAFAFLGGTLFSLSMLFEHSSPYYWQPYNLKNLIRPFIQALGPSIAALSFLLFAYFLPHFKKTEKREFIVVIMFSVSANLATLGLTFYNFVILQRTQSNFQFELTYYRILTGSLGLQFLLIIFLLIRKTIRLSAGDPRPGLIKIIKPAGRNAKAVQALALVLLIPLAAVIAYVLRYFGILPPTPTIYLVDYVFLLFYFSSIVTYLYYTEENMTFQLKLVGGALSVMLAIIGIAAIIVGRSYERDYVNKNFVSNRSTIHFSLNHYRSYDIAQAPFRYDPDMGPKTAISYGEGITAELKFAFPFFDHVYDKIYILSGPMIYLGEKNRENGWGGYHPQPVIAPIIMNLDPSSGGDIFLKSELEKATITWYEIPEFNRPSKNTIQLILYKNGSFDISYVKLNPDLINRSLKIDVVTTANISETVRGGRGSRGVSFAPRLIGIHPGGSDAALKPIRFMNDLPFSSTAPEAIFEAYDIEYYHYLHRRIAPLAILLIGSSIFILFFFPIFFKASLIKPLQLLYKGIEKANDGDLDVKISPRFNDEIGFLSRSFNQMLQSIKRAENNFRTLAENARDGIFIIYESGESIYVNKSASAITGFSNTELMKMSFNGLLRSDAFDSAIDQYSKDPEKKQLSKNYEAYLKVKNSSQVPVEVTVSGTVWHGKPARVVIVRDIRERKSNEEQARQQQQQLMKMDKLTSLGVLVAGVAHEINNPNQTILSNASFLVRACPMILSILGDYRDEHNDFLVAGIEYEEFRNSLSGLIGGIGDASNRIDGIVKGLKAYSRDDPGNLMTSLDVNDVIRTSIKLLENYIKKATGHFTLRLENDIPGVKGNAQKLEQVIINLTLNACQALTDSGQAISVHSSYNKKQNTAIIKVSDEGTGIPEEHMAKIKTPFFTTKRAQGGTGLGLHVSESIVGEHKGTISFDSLQGKGTVATISLPVEEGL